MNLGSLDPALGCSGLMSILSYDSHRVTRAARITETGDCGDTEDNNSYTKEKMDLEIARVTREMYKAFNGLNEGFAEAKDQIVIDELSTHTDESRKELIHPYKTLYGRSLNYVLKDNLGDNWEAACVTLMSEVRMYELECLRRRMEDKVAAAAAKEVELEELNLDLASAINGGYEAKNGSFGEEKIVESIIDDMAKQQTDEDFTGHSCLLVTWKTNPEIEKFKDLYMESEVKTHKRKSKHLVDPGDLVSEKSLQKSYNILGQGQGLERLLVKNKKGNLEEIDGDPYRYYLLAGTTHPYPDDTFYSVGRVPRKLLMKYLGVKMYLVRLRRPPPPPPPEPRDWRLAGDIAKLALAGAGITAPTLAETNINNIKNSC